MIRFLEARAITGVEIVTNGSYSRVIEIGSATGSINVTDAPAESALRVAVRFPKLEVLPAIIATGTKYILLITVAALVPCILLLVMGVLLALLLPREAGPSGGRGWPPSPSDGPQEPPWWPVFEREFRQHVGETHRDLVSTRPAK